MAVALEITKLVKENEQKVNRRNFQVYTKLAINYTLYDQTTLFNYFCN